jgi:Dyp-type peroxidase family
MAVDALDLGDIQGIVRHPYRKLPYSRFVLVEIREPAAAKGWLRTLVRDVRAAARADAQADEKAVHIAFTAAGLAQLGVTNQARPAFAQPFLEGICGTAQRSTALGDVDESAPANWYWGARGSREIHAVVMLYADSAAARDALCAAYVGNGLRGGAINVVWYIDAWVPLAPELSLKEHFGFKDGIGQPRVAGMGLPENPAGSGPGGDGAENTVAPGEFLLGHGNQLRGVTPAGPRVVDPGGIKFDLGRNGSYMVLRQLYQDVYGFWKFLEGEGPLAELRRRGAFMVGRWPSGAPLVKAPDRDDPALGQNDRLNDTFGFRDQSGKLIYACPMGAHIRRSNPRDSLEGVGTNSVQVANLHRLIRRSRPYGEPLMPSMEPEDYLNAPDESHRKERGLIFIAFNADLERQFEFVQGTWINGRHFTPTQQEVDPVVGEQPEQGGLFTIERGVVRQRFGVTGGLRRFVTVRGGGYFFMPGLRALKYLAS